MMISGGEIKNSKQTSQSRWLYANMLHVDTSVKEDVITVQMFYFQHDLQAKLQLRYEEIAKR